MAAKTNHSACPSALKPLSYTSVALLPIKWGLIQSKKKIPVSCWPSLSNVLHLLCCERLKFVWTETIVVLKPCSQQLQSVCSKMMVDSANYSYRQVLKELLWEAGQRLSDLLLQVFVASDHALSLWLLFIRCSKELFLKTACVFKFPLRNSRRRRRGVWWN